VRAAHFFPSAMEGEAPFFLFFKRAGNEAPSSLRVAYSPLRGTPPATPFTRTDRALFLSSPFPSAVCRYLSAGFVFF